MTNQLKVARQAAVNSDFETAYEIWLPLANTGVAEAQNAIGYCYHNGKVVTKDVEEALRWYHLAADQGFHKAQYNLGYCNRKGVGVSVNFEEAIRWYSLAAEQGDKDAEHHLGMIYKDTPDGIQDRGLAVSFFERAAKSGHRESMYQLAKLLQETKKDNDRDVAYQWLQKAADSDHPEALQELGLELFYGLGQTKDTVKGLAYLERSGLRGNSGAAFLAGDIYAGGYQCEKNYEKARKLFTFAFFEGSMAAAKKLAIMAKRGDGGPKDIPLVISILRVLYEYDDDLEAASALGQMYLFGDDVDKDLVAAEEWLLKAGEGFDVNAQYHLGVLYSQGACGFNDPQKGEYWFRKAAEQGDEGARKRLGYC